MARMSDVELERLKRDVSLVRLCEAKGVALKHHGPDNLVGNCPFHEDKTPSFVVSPKKNLWHCLGACKAGGSVIDFVMKAEGVSFRHAVELLRNDVPLSKAKAGEVKESTVRRLASPVSTEADDATLLGQVTDYYRQQLKASPEARAYLAKRGLDDEGLIAHFRLGYANRTLGLRLPESNRTEGEKVRARLQRLGVYRETGHEALNGSLVVPLIDEAGAVVGMYGRKVTPGLRAGTPQHLYLPGPHRCAFNSKGLAEGNGIAILCEAVIDAMSFWAAGFRNVTAAYGVEGFTVHHLEALRRHQVRDVLIAYDRDDAGDAAAKQLTARLGAEGFDCYRVEFPRGMDVNEYALKVKPASKSLGVALRHATFMGPATPRRGVPAPFPSSPLVALADDAGAGAPSKAVPEGKEEGRRVAVTTSAKDATAVASTEAVPVALDTSRAAPTVVASPAAVTSPTIAKAAMSTAASPATIEATPTAVPSPAVVIAPELESTVARGSAVVGIAAPATAVMASTSPTTAPPAPAATSATPATTTEDSATEDEAVFHFGPRRYRVRGLAKGQGPEALRCSLLLAVGEAFHVDTFDMYSAKGRMAFVQQAAQECGLNPETVKRDMGQLLLKLEALLEKRRAEKAGPKVPTLTEAERDEALTLLRTPNLLARILEDFTRCGVVGEETNKLVGYLAAISRKLEEPLAVLIQSSSAAGKSSLMEAVLAFVPDEEKTKFSAMTGQSLFYMGDVSLSHKVLAVVEEEGASRAAYALKLLQSEGELTIASTGKDPHTGRLVTHEYHVEGPTQLFLTTTASELDEELLNRCFVLTVDEDRAQTAAIHRLQRERRTLEGRLARKERDGVLKVHQDAQRLLRPLAVVNPYARVLSFPAERTRARRDFPKYLTLIDAIALLHQYQRPVKTAQRGQHVVEYIEVTPEDIQAANRLAASVLAKSLDELAPQTRRLLGQLDDFVSARVEETKQLKGEVRFTRREVREALGLRHSQLALHLGRLVDFEYLVLRRDAHGAHAYSLRDFEAPSTPALTDVVGAAAAAETSTTAQLPGGEVSFRGLPGASGGEAGGQFLKRDNELRVKTASFRASGDAHSVGASAAPSYAYSKVAEVAT